MRDILGQTRAVETLQAALRSERIHHAWIFHGPQGVGKFTTAISFARILLDPNASASPDGLIDGDPADRTAELIRAGTHPDLHIVNRQLAAFSADAETRRRKQTVIPVEVIREFVLQAAFRSGHHQAAAGSVRASKAIIIDEADLMNVAAQNTLLKVLEEPPMGTVLILITANEEELLQTIRSRCQRVGFFPLDEMAMQQWFAQAGGKLNIERAQWSWLLRFAEGSPGLAQIASERGLFNWHQVLAPMLDDARSGRFRTELGGTMASLVEADAAAWVKANPNGSKESANRAAAGYLFMLLAQCARNWLRDDLAQDHDPGRSLQMIDAIERAQHDIDANMNMSMLLENLAVQMCNEHRTANAVL